MSIEYKDIINKTDLEFTDISSEQDLHIYVEGFKCQGK